MLIAGCVEERQTLVCHVLSLQEKKKTINSQFSAVHQGVKSCECHFIYRVTLTDIPVHRDIIVHHIQSYE